MTTTTTTMAMAMDTGTIIERLFGVYFSNWRPSLLKLDRAVEVVNAAERIAVAANP